MATYFVNTSGNDTTGNGSEAAPWQSIQKAVDTVSTGSLHTIKVGGGVYNEPTYNYLFINRADLRVNIQADLGIPVIRTSTTDQVVRLHTGLDSGTPFVGFKGILMEPLTVAGTGTIYVSSLRCPLELQDCTVNGTTAAINYAASLSALETRILVLKGACQINGGSNHAMLLRDLAALIIDPGSTLQAPSAYRSIFLVPSSGSTICKLVRIRNLTCTQGIRIPDYYEHVDIQDVDATINAATGTVAIELGRDTDSPLGSLGKIHVKRANVRYLNGPSHGVLIGEGAEDALIEDCRVEGADIAYVVKGAGAKVVGCTAYAPRGLYLKGATGGYHAHNTIVLSPATPGYGYGALHWEMDPQRSNRPARKNTIVDNVFDAAAGQVGYARAVYLTAGFHGNIVDRNVYRPGPAGLAFVDGVNYSEAQLAALQDKWLTTWTGGELGYWPNDQLSVVGDPLLTNPAGGDFSVPVNSLAFGNAGAWSPLAGRAYGAVGVVGNHGPSKA